MAHTPGPWVIEFDKGGDEYYQGDWIIRSPSGEALMGNTAYYPWQSGNPYDAILTAAAPELLEALKESVAVAARNERGAWLDRAQAAIAKAEGK